MNKSSLHIHKILSEVRKIAIDNGQFLCFISVYETNPAERGSPDFLKIKTLRYAGIS